MTDQQTYIPILTIHGHTRSISALAFSPDGTLLASAGADRLVKIWSVATGALRLTLKGHALGISDVKWSIDGRFIATASDDRSVRVWDAESGQEVRRLLGHTSFVFCLAYNPQSSLLVSGSFDETLRLWDLRKGICHRSIPAHSEAVSGVDFNRDGTTIVSCSYDGLIRLWDTATGQCLKTLVHDGNAAVSYVRFTPSASHLLAASLDSTIRLWDVPNARVVKSFTGHQNRKFASACVLTAPRIAPRPLDSPPDTQDGSADPKAAEKVARDRARRAEMQRRGMPEIWLISGSEDNRLYVWDLQSKEVRMTLQAHRDVVLGIAAHPTQDIIASAALDHDACIKLWALSPSLEEDTTHATPVALAPRENSTEATRAMPEVEEQPSPKSTPAPAQSVDEPMMVDVPIADMSAPTSPKQAWPSPQAITGLEAMQTEPDFVTPPLSPQPETATASTASAVAAQHTQDVAMETEEARIQAVFDPPEEVLAEAADPEMI